MIQPIFYRSAVRVHPVVAIVVVLAGAQLAGILGALLAIPIAASLAALYEELWPSVAGRRAGAGRRGARAGAARR